MGKDIDWEMIRRECPEAFTEEAAAASEALLKRVLAVKYKNGHPVRDPDRRPQGQDGEAGLIEDESR